MSGPLQGKLDLHDVLPTPYENLLATDLPWSVANNATIGGVGGGGGWDFFSAACWFTLKGIADANAARGAAVPLGGIVQCYGGEFLSAVEVGQRLWHAPCGSGDPQARPFSGGLRLRRLRPAPRLPARLAATTGATARACTTHRSPRSSSGRRPSPASCGTRCGCATKLNQQLHPSLCRILVDCVRPFRVRAGRAECGLRRPSPDRLLLVCAARTHRRLAHLVWESRPPLRHLFARCVGSHVGFLPSLASHTGTHVVRNPSQA